MTGAVPQYRVELWPQPGTDLVVVVLLDMGRVPVARGYTSASMVRGVLNGIALSVQVSAPRVPQPEDIERAPRWGDADDEAMNA